MTTLTGGSTYVPRRRFADRPAEQRAARHRATEAAAVALVAQLVEALLVAGRALASVFGGSWGARTVTRAAVVIVVASVLVGLTLAAGAVVLTAPLRGEPRPAHVQVHTPTPTPFPDGWTYGP
jgi:hypothetical protein